MNIKPEACTFSGYSHKWAEKSAILNHLQFKKSLDEFGYNLNIYDDFPQEFLPFYEQLIFEELPSQTKKKLLSYAWVIYNYKTIVIEQSILTEFCKIILSGNSNFKFTSEFIASLSQIQMDETYHTYFSYLGINLCQNISKSEIHELPKLDLYYFLSRTYQKDAFYQELRLLALSVVCETTLSKYLSVMPKDGRIQPSFRLITETHRKDEGAHHQVFSKLVKIFFEELSLPDQQFLYNQITSGVRAIQAKDKSLWKFVFNKLNINRIFPENDKFNHLFNFHSLGNLIPSRLLDQDFL